MEEENLQNRRSIDLEYNINGIGIVTPVIYPFVSKLYTDNKLKIESKLKDINQLGVIKFIHNGAHYTRYEYVLLQFMLINFVKNNSEWGLGSKFNFSSWSIKELSYKNKISGAEILELMVLFGNIGHFKDTFSSNKVWFHYLYINKYELRNSLKKGLIGEGKTLLDQLLSSGNSHKAQWINTLFVLSRSEKLKDYRKICEGIASKVFYEHSDKWLDLYNKIRKVSYVVLDSHYSHIPISISLQNVLFNEKLFVDELSKYSSGLMGAFERVTDLLEDTLYLENNALLMGTYRSMDINIKLIKILENNQDSGDITKINMLITDEKSPFYEDFKISESDIPWNKEKNLSITYFMKDREYFPKDVFQKELEVSGKLGKEGFVAISFSPSFAKYRTVYSISKKLFGYKLINQCLKIIRVALNDYKIYSNYSYESVSNGQLHDVIFKKIFTYLFRNLLIEDYFCEYEYYKDHSPFIIENGSTKTLRKIENYIKEYRKVNPNEKDALHELDTVKKSIESMNYKGVIIVYLGSLRFINKDKQSICELDGLILTPNNREELLRVIEAKNIKKQKRAIVAAKQLEDKFLPLLPDSMIEKVIKEPISGYGAQIKLRN